MTLPPEAPGDRPIRAWYYRPRTLRSAGAYLVCPGLHYLGPADPRLDRFCAILAGSGLEVLSPFLPDYLEQQVRPGVLRDVRRAWEALQELRSRPARGRAGLFSISFGSFPALRLAASPEYADQVGGVVTFGGYADFRETIEFCLAGPQRDPLNAPVIFLHVVELLNLDDRLTESVKAAWRAFVRATWGRPEMKEGQAYRALAHTMSRSLPEEVRELFLVGCDAAPGGAELWRQVTARHPDRVAELDPRAHLHGLRCPVYILHGVDDDVIPVSQAAALEAALPPAARRRVFRTGLYRHTTGLSPGELVRRTRGLLGELWQMLPAGWAVARVAAG